MPSPLPRRRRVAGHRLDPTTIPLLVTLGLGVFAGALDLGVLSPALPALGIAFGAGRARLAVGVHALSAGERRQHPDHDEARRPQRPPPDLYRLRRDLRDRFRRSRSASQNCPMFLTARAIQAFGAGGIFPVATAAIADRIPPERRGAALGLVAATWGVAAIVGPLFGGIVTHLLSWHWIFAPMCPLAIVVIAMARTTLPVTVANVRGPLDVPGIALLAAGLVALMIGLTQYDVTGATSNLRPRLILTVPASSRLAAFVFVERRAREPVIPPRFFTRRPARARLRARDPDRHPRRRAVLHPGRAGRRRAPHLRGRRRDRGDRRGDVRGRDSGRRPRARCRRQPRRARGRHDLTALGLAIFAFGFADAWVAIAAMVVAGTGFGALLGAPTRYIVTNRAGSQQRGRGRRSAVGVLDPRTDPGRLAGRRRDRLAAPTRSTGIRIAYLWFTGDRGPRGAA